MCRAVNCEKCGRTTWAGCGKHIDSVMRDVAPSDRCHCDRTAGAATAAVRPGRARASHGAGKRGLLSGLFQRRA